MSWDMGGSDKIRSLLRHFYGLIDAIVFVVDGTDRDRLEVARDELHKLLLEVPSFPGKVRKLGESVPVLVFVNKQDVEGALTVGEAETALDLMGPQEVDWSARALQGGLLMGTHHRAGAASQILRLMTPHYPIPRPAN